MTKFTKKVAVFALSAVAATTGAAGAVGLKSFSADAAVTEIDPIAKYEFKDSSNFGKDSMGNYDMSYRNKWVEGSTGPVWDKGTLIEGGGVEFNGEFCVAQDQNNNIFKDVTAFTLAFEFKGSTESSFCPLVGVSNGSYGFNVSCSLYGGTTWYVLLQVQNADGIGTSWNGAYIKVDDPATYFETFHEMILSFQPGGQLNAWYDGASFTSAGKLPSDLSSDWTALDQNSTFAVGAAYNGACVYPSTGAVKNVVFYDFAMDEACATAYYTNGKVTPADVTGLKTITGAEVTESSFANGATKTTLNEAMSLADMLSQMNAATAAVTLSDGTATTAPVTWTEVVKTGDKYYANGVISTSKLGYANTYGTAVSYELTVAGIKGVGDPVFADDEITSGELRDSMTEAEMLALINRAQVEVTLGDDSVQTVEVTFTRIEAEMGVYTAYAEVLLNGSSVGTVQVTLTVTQTNEGAMQELLPVAKWEFNDAANIGKDSMGNYNLGPVAIEGGDLGNPRGMGTIENGVLYLDGTELLGCTALNDIGDNLNNGFTLNFQYKQDGDQPWELGWSSPVSFGFNDWSVSTTCRFLIANNSTQLRVGAHGVATSEDGNTYWGPVVLNDGTDAMHNVSLSVRPGETFNVYVDGALAYSADCPAGWSPAHSNMAFAIGGECVWGNGYNLFKGWIDNVSIYNFALSLEQSNAYWAKGKVVVGDMNGEIITSISETPVFENGEVTNGKLTDRLTDTQAVRRVNAATVDALFENGKTVSLSVAWQRLEKQGDKWYIVGSVDTSDIGYATLLSGAQTVKQEVTVERAARTVTVARATNGTVSADKEEAYLGDTVTITLTPNEGYAGDTVTVNGVALMANADGTYTYVVEGIEDIEISVTFKTAASNGNGDNGNGDNGDKTDPGTGDKDDAKDGPNVLAIVLGVVGGVVVVAGVAVAIVLVLVRKKKNAK